MRLWTTPSLCGRAVSAGFRKAGVSGFFPKLLVALLTVNILTSGVLILIAYVFSSDTIHRRTKENILQQVATIVERFGHEYRHELKRHLKTFINHPLLNDYLLASVEERLIVRKKLERQFRELQKYIPDYYSISFVDENGDIAVSTNGMRRNERMNISNVKPGATGMSPRRDAIRSLFRQLQSTPLLLSAGEQRWSMPRQVIHVVGPFTHNGQAMVTAGLGKLDADTGTFGGAVVVELHFNQFIAELAEIRFFDENPVWLYDMNGNILHKPGNIQLALAPDGQFVSGLQATPRVIDAKDGIVVYQDLAIVPDSPMLRLAMSIPSDLLLKDLNPAIRFFSMVLIVSFFLLILICYYISDFLSKPVIKLQNAEAKLVKAQKIAKLGYWEWNVDQGIMQWSREAAAILGIDCDDTREDPDDFFREIHPEDRAAFHESVSRVMTTGESASVEQRIVRSDGRELFVHQEIQLKPDNTDSEVQLTGTIQDITKQKAAESQIRQLAYFDKVTGLANRSLLDEQTEIAIEQARKSGRHVGILFLDLDHFKRINDSKGHNAGDELLRKVAERLNGCIRRNDSLYAENPQSADTREPLSSHTVARLGGDEFIMLLTDLRHAEDAELVVARVQQTLAKAFTISGKDLYVTASIGISVYPDDGTSVEELLKHADAAMYAAKSKGRNRHVFYTARLERDVQQRLVLETSLHHAVERQEFQLFYQPRIDLKTGIIVGVEALLRWIHPEKGVIPPQEFIFVAEETELIVPIGRWVLESACRQIKTWHEAGHSDLNVSVNLSPVQLARPDFKDIVTKTLNDTGVAARHLELELTENVITENVDACANILAELKEIGTRISIDDFGTGYSSLSLLKRLPVDILKIDRSFIRDVLTDSDDALIAKTTIALGHNLRLRVVAEGVEEPGQLDFLHAHDCDEAQGYLFGVPKPAPEISQMLSKRMFWRVEPATKPVYAVD